MNQTAWHGRNIDILTLAKAAETVTAATPWAAFERLAAQLNEGAEDLVNSGTGQAPALPVQWSFRGEARAVPGSKQSEIWGHLSAEVLAPTQCKRCMGPMQLPIAVGRSFLFVATEALAAELDDEMDDDVLVYARDFDVLALVEDELLMAAPVAPLHEVCPATDVTRAAVRLSQESALADAPRANPFAALAGALAARK